MQAVGKPGWAAEASRDWLPGGDQADPDGRFLTRALWWSWVQGLAGSSWAWWWDTHVQPNGLTRQHAALARFLRGEDPRGARAVSVAAMAGDTTAGALVAADRAWVFADDPRSWDPAAPATGPARPGVHRLRLAGLAPGAWQVELWEPLTGAVVATLPAEIAADGTLELDAPALPAAWKLIRQRPLLPGLSVPAP